MTIERENKMVQVGYKVVIYESDQFSWAMISKTVCFLIFKSEISHVNFNGSWFYSNVHLKLFF